MTDRPRSFLWTDPSNNDRSVRLDALVAEMTLEEKLGQLGSKWQGFAPDNSDNVGPMQDMLNTDHSLVRGGAPARTRPRRASLGAVPVAVEQGIERLVAMQSDVLDRLG